MISKFRPSGNVDRQLEQVSKKINELIDAVNQPSTYEGKGTERESLRKVKKADGTYAVEFLFGDGWVTTTSGALELKEE